MNITHPSLESHPFREDIFEFYSTNNKDYLNDNSYKKFYHMFSHFYTHLYKVDETTIRPSENEIEFLFSLTKNISHPYIKVVLLVYLYKHTKNIIKPTDILNEYSLYYNFLISSNITHKSMHHRSDLEFALDLMLKSNQHDNYPIILDYPFYLSQVRKEDANFGVTAPLDIILKVDKKNRFNKSMYNRIMIDFNKLFANEKFLELPASYFLFENMLLCAKRIGDESLFNKIENQKKEFLFAKVVEGKPTFLHLPYLEALGKMTLSEEERLLVHRLIKEVNIEMSKHMKPIKIPIDKSIQEDLESLFQEFERKIKNSNSLIEALLFITEEFSPISKKELDELNNEQNNSFLTSMFTKHTIGEDGFFTNNISENYSFMIDFHCKIILQIIRILKKYYAVKKEDLLPLITNNIFVPEKFIYLFLEGLYKIIELDMFTASRFIILNSETLIKHIANIQSIVIKKQKKDYYEDKITIEQILEDKRFSNATSTDIAYNLNLILYNDEGFKLRHRVAHGILNDNESQSIVPLLSLFILWLRILFIGKSKS